MKNMAKFRQRFNKSPKVIIINIILFVIKFAINFNKTFLKLITRKETPLFLIMIKLFYQKIKICFTLAGPNYPSSNHKQLIKLSKKCLSRRMSNFCCAATYIELLSISKVNFNWLDSGQELIG